MIVILTTVDALLKVPPGTIVDTGSCRRERTHHSDEWDMVMTSEEILVEGNGSVDVIWQPEPRKER